MACSIISLLQTSPGGVTAKRIFNIFLKIPGNSFKTIIQRSYNLLIYILLSHSEMMPGKFDIFLPINSCQMENRHTLIKRTGRADKHLSHQMTLRTGKHKAGIRTMLNIGYGAMLPYFFPDIERLAETHQLQQYKVCLIRKNNEISHPASSPVI